MIKAIIFDMDGLLVDSEPLWEAAAVKVFNKVGVPLTIEMTKQTMSLRSDDVVRYWHTRYPWQEPSQKYVEEDLIDTVIRLLHTSDIVHPGALEIINLVNRHSLPMAIASSSPLRLIKAALARMKVLDKMQVIHSAHNESHGKPHPAVFITTAEKLGFQPEDCLVFEDSGNGVLAAKAAKMKCIAVPDAKQRGNKLLTIADLELSSLLDFKISMLEQF